MIMSNMFLHHKSPQPQFAPLLFVALLAIFALVGQARPIIGLVGIGTTAIITAVLVEVNRERIWETYRKQYKKQRGMKGLWTAPNRVYYTINVMVLWPFIFFLGFLCLWAAYALS
ncbi:MAG TPA: hypothetical protein VMS08_05710 [Candidatus Saccharimonadia bacterium]|nr:hypothetical protein [Candidatus Saccharimonadia bacterium]